MYQNNSEYDRGVNIYSPEGRLFQVEYAIRAVNLGSTAVGIKTADGVVLAVEKRLSSSLLVPSSVEKIMEIDSHLGAAVSGLVSDARTLIDHARVEAQNHRFTYNEPIAVEALTQSTCDLALGFGEDGDESKMSRPFGAALLIGGYDEEKGPQLYFTDPSGNFVQYKAKAIGAGAKGAQTNLQESYSENMSFAEAENLALTTLRMVMEEAVTAENVEIARVNSEGYHSYEADELTTIIERI